MGALKAGDATLPLPLSPGADPVVTRPGTSAGADPPPVSSQEVQH